MVKLIVDNTEIQADEGTTLLHACLESGIYIPNLCHMEGMEDTPASCRLCFVEIDGEPGPVTSCTVTVREGMTVRTDGPSVRGLQRTAFQLLMSVHQVDCKNCPANKKCELQRIAKFLKVGLKPKRLEQFFKEPAIDQDHPFLDYFLNRCVLCGRCIFVCKRDQGRPFLTFAKRGLDTVISFYGEQDMLNLPCEKCLACVEICPVSAITLKNDRKHTKAP